MKRTVVLQPEAVDDVEAAYDWYERQRPGLGSDFVNQLSAVFERLAETPELYAVIWESIRSVRLCRFPYIVYYRIKVESVEVLGVLHGSRHPTTWQDRS